MPSLPRTFSGPNLLQIAMPMGGIGAGCICLNGDGGLQDFSIRNKPSTSAVPDGFEPIVGAFAILHVRGGATRLIEGPMPPERIYDQGLQSQGFRRVGHEGLPRFGSAEFTSEYPFGTAKLTDPGVPIEAEITGWNPFIPLDDVNSGIPCAILDYKLTNASNELVEFEFSFHSTHLAKGKEGDQGTRNALIPGGVLFSNTDDPKAGSFGTGSIIAAGGGTETTRSSCLAFPNARTPNQELPLLIKAMWFRGGWFDSVSALWSEVSTGEFKPNDGKDSEKGHDGNNGGSLMISARLEPGESLTIPIVIAWHFPNCDRVIGHVGEQPVNLVWHPFYTTRWKDAAEVAAYVAANCGDLRRRTRAFADALYSSTLPSAALDAISANLAILKSPTVLRQSSGNVWAWEGCCTDRGCCHGSCTHVWNYAQAMPHLFPALERTLREQEYRRSMDSRGHVNFRSALPDAETNHDFHAASDGQLGGILKLYRDWQICGDDAWLSDLYPLAKRSLDYCIGVWDPDRRGALFEPHHNTYDIEFWGPDGMCSSIYIGALCAIALMARHLGKPQDAEGYESLAAKGAMFLDEKLFNGEYYEHRVQWEGLRDTSFAESIAGEPADEMAALLKAEGPKYQYGTGCISDGVIGAWMAAIYGVETPLSRDHIRGHLKSIHRHNFKSDLSEHACTQRPGYALGAEPGTLLCTWPRGSKPTLPFVYSDEVWTGIEYQVASHMIEEGLVDEGLTIVEAVRSRYDGHVRNPFNEYECGSYYARAMASYALLGALSGFRYSAATKTLSIAPRLRNMECADSSALSLRPDSSGPEDSGQFVTFFSTNSGFGTLTLTARDLVVEIVEGKLAIEQVSVRGARIESRVVVTPAQPGRIEFQT